MSIRLILYDLDGTLADTREDLSRAVNRTLTDLGLATRPHQELFGFVGNGVRPLLTEAVGENDPDGLDHALTIFRTHYLTHLTDHTTLYPGVDKVMTAFADRDQAIVTNKPSIYTAGVVANLGLKARVGLVLSGDTVPRPKPDPDMLHAALDHFGVSPEQAVMVGDGPPDVQAARSAGIRSVILTCGMNPEAVVREAGADHLIDHIEALISIVHGLDGGGAR